MACDNGLEERWTKEVECMQASYNAVAGVNLFTHEASMWNVTAHCFSFHDNTNGRESNHALQFPQAMQLHRRASFHCMHHVKRITATGHIPPHISTISSQSTLHY